ncbi:MAG TPA: polysaccharide deacetylase family protein [Pseudonocardiaceae bacterium]|nr:polysaccharide deacetylase family protein [Pseudonocardiaceae bacterium]
MSEAIQDIRPDDRPSDRSGGHPGARRRRSLPPVLMYHSVEPYEQDPYLVTVSPGRFERQLRWLHRRGLRGTSMRELLAARRTGTGAGLVGLTFDDGYADFHEHALPALARYGFTATVFVIAGLLGGTNSWDPAGPRKALMDADGVRDVARRGIEIGSHGMRHVSLTSCDELVAEVSESRATLTELTGEKITGFCYPYGHLDAAALEAVRASGYDYGCAIWRSPLTSTHALPRIYVGDRDGSLRLLAKWYRNRYQNR